MSQRKSFDSECWALLEKIPTGRVTTYSAIARALNSKAYRAVGRAMNRNPAAPKVPCHRVVKSDGSLGGYAFGAKKKAALLKAEGIRLKAGKIEDFKERLYLFPFRPEKRKAKAIK